MTNLTLKSMIAAATLMVAAGSASAQTLTAQIPFPFRAGSKVMAAGNYSVHVTQFGSVPVFRIAGADNVLLLGGPANDADKQWRKVGQPVLSFQCGARMCDLAAIWTGGTDPAYKFTYKSKGDDPVHTALVVMKNDKGD